MITVYLCDDISKTEKREKKVVHLRGMESNADMLLSGLPIMIGGLAVWKTGLPR